MNWVNNYDLFLFDCDGLLVDTESIHFQAYINMAARRGVQVGWTFPEFLSYAHRGSDHLENGFKENFPSLTEQDPWPVLYAEKKKAYLDLLGRAKIDLLPGVYALIDAVDKAGKKSVVVTNSPKEQMDFIKERHPILKKIPHWVTRENYTLQKPNPECYLRAIELYGDKGDKIIGFEDSVRGFMALSKTPALPVLVCSEEYPLLNCIADPIHFERMDLIPEMGPINR